MAVETPEELEAFFNPEEFGTELTLKPTAGGSIAFNGIVTSGYNNENTNRSQASSTDIETRILARRRAVVDIRQGDLITIPGGAVPGKPDAFDVQVVDLGYKGEVLIIYYHDVW